ncbi:hypothetical protein JJB09_13810 [Rhizobium sp. KVB221]|uniref:Uncharacterized protein n=2 Tax=Rhizobium setariae TaxID=2801340 RepID=A0A936YR90_9HYPH|nr:hypothetical protein [Rhizobium setariae]
MSVGNSQIHIILFIAKGQSSYVQDRAPQMWLIVRLALFPNLLKAITRILWGKTYRRLGRQKVEGQYRHAANFSHKASVEEKLVDLRSEFAGSNELCLEVLKRIIQIRRNEEAEKNWLFVFGAVLNQPNELFGNLTLRWIVSVLDTFSDMPCSSEYRLAAGQLRSFSLGVRLGLTMGLQSVPDPKTHEEPLHFMNKEEIWDGIIHFNYKWGDTYRTLLLRVARDVESIPAMRVAWSAILKRLVVYPPFDIALRKNKESRRIFEEVTGWK